MESIKDRLKETPDVDKVMVFDLLVEMMQGTGKHITTYYKYATKGTGFHAGQYVRVGIPVYEFVLRMNGHDDFLDGVLKLLER